MSETVNQEATIENEVPAAEKTFTQKELDAIVAERLKRERTKYEGFDELKAKAAKFDELEEASKSELQKVTERAEKLQRLLRVKCMMQSVLLQDSFWILRSLLR